MSGAERVRPNRDIVLHRRNQLGQTLGAKGFETRRRLLAATAELLEKVPLTDLRVSQIVRLAKTSPGTFYVYFSDVYEAVLDLVGEVSQSPPKILNFLEGSWTGERALPAANAFVSMYLEQFQVHAALFRVRDLASEEGDVRFTRLRMAAVSPLVAAMETRIVARQKAGLLPSDFDARAAAGGLLAMIERLGMLRFEHDVRVKGAWFVDVAVFFAALLMADGPVDLSGAAPFEDTEPAPPRWSTQLRPIRDPVVNLHGQTIGPKGARTRSRLLEIARDLLAEKPLLEVSVNEIARRADISASVFWIYFRDVLDVVYALVVDLTQSTPDLQETVSAEWTEANRGQLSLRFARSYMAHWKANSALFRVRNIVSDEGNRAFLEVRTESVRPLLMSMMTVIAERQAQGRAPRHLNPAAAAASLLAMLERLSAVSNLATMQTSTDSLARAAAFYLATLMDGVRPPDSVRL